MILSKLSVMVDSDPISLLVPQKLVDMLLVHEYNMHPSFKVVKVIKIRHQCMFYSYAFIVSSL